MLAVAGSGKTTYLVKRLTLDKRSLVITYTNNNFRNLRYEIIKKFGFFPENIRLYTYFSFLYSFCFRPLISLRIISRGINFNKNPIQRISEKSSTFYFDRQKRIYSNRIAKYIIAHNLIEDLNSRIIKYFDELFIDEIQDFGGHDFNLLKIISKNNLDITYVGDFFQHTYDTSLDRNVNKNLHENYSNYVKFFRDMGVEPDFETLNRSYRCNPTICEFITNKLGVQMYSHRDDFSTIVVINSQEEADAIYQNDKVVKLFYQEHYKYDCYSGNWGDCKGVNNYYDVCVVLNKMSLDNFQDNLLNLAPITRNKLYVACTRTRNNLYFLPHNFIDKYKRRNK